MTDASCQPTPADPASPEPFAARPEACGGAGPREPDQTDEFVRMLNRLAVLGMALTEDLVADAREAIAERRAARAARVAAAAAAPAAAAEAGPEPGPELTPHEMAARDPSMLDFERLTRSLRLSMALAQKFQDDRRERERKAATQHAEAETKRKALRKAQLKSAVQQTIEGECKAGRVRGIDGQYSLNRALRERLDHEDIERDIARYPLSALIARICRGLGIVPDWTLWCREFWALEEARLKTPGSPYVEAAQAELSNAELPEPQPVEPESAEPESAEPGLAKPGLAKPGLAEPGLAEAKPPEAEPGEIEPDESKPMKLTPPEAEPPAARPPDAPPGRPPAAPPIRAFDRWRPLTAEEQRANEEHAARIKTRHYNGL